MGLASRLTTLLKADAHGVVDAVEDRSLLLKQYVREAEAELVRKRARLEALEVEAKSLEEAKKHLAVESKRWDEDATLALRGEKEELARFAVKKLLVSKRRSEQAERRIEQVREEREGLLETIARQELELDDLQAKVKAFLARVNAGDGEIVLDAPVADEEVEIELLRRKAGA